MAGTIEINLGESFDHLTHAPITEAVIEIRARAMVPWEEKEILPQIKDRLADYPEVQPVRGYRGAFEFQPDESSSRVEDLGWKGIRAYSADKKQIAQFHRDLFSFSRLAPYNDWNHLQTEAHRLWDFHQELAQPAEMQRLGVRFINQLPVPTEDLQLENYFTEAPKCPKGLEELPFSGFLHRESFVVSGTPYGITVTRTIQTPGKDEPARIQLILDVDVFTLNPATPSEESLLTHLGEMRWLKNKVFFGSFTPAALNPFR